jgi:glycosyltransferase involved in cell wall biosynthesis
MKNKKPLSDALKQLQDMRPKPITIMQVIPALEQGGVEQGVIDINKALAAEGVRSLVVTSGGRRVHDITKHGGEVIILDVKSKNPLMMMRNIFALKKLIHRYEVDVVHAVSRVPAWSAFYAVQKTKARFVTSVHAAHKISSTLKQKYNAIMTKGERVIAVSHYLKNHLINHYQTPPEKIKVIHRGIDPAFFHPNRVTPDRMINLAKAWRIPDGSFVVLLPGRVTPAKGHLLLLEAIATLMTVLARNDLCLIFLGSSKDSQSYRKKLERKMTQLNLIDKVRFVEHCQDMPAAYMLANAVVVPSILPEGFGRTAIEAEAMGRPVIVAEAGGLAETVLHGQTGFTIKMGDEAALAKNLAYLIKMTDAERIALAEKAMAHVAAHFTLEKMCADSFDVYAELLGEKTQDAKDIGD